MKVIKSDSSQVVYQKIFTQLMDNHSPIVLWQVLPEDGKREITHSKISNFHFETRKLHFDLEKSTSIKTEIPIYCYSEAGPLIFKSKIKEIKNAFLSLELPSEVKLLDEPEVIRIKGAIGINTFEIWKVKRLDLGTLENEDSNIIRVKAMSERSTRDQDLLNQEFGPSPDEEERLFASQRESPRARPKISKSVRIIKADQTEASLYTLFDLSRGGMAFVISNENEFTKGDQLKVSGFNDFILDDPLLGTIMSIRPVDETKQEFKVGVKFSDGQN